MEPLELGGGWYRDDHFEFRETVRRFVAREITPYVADWDEAGGFPRELYAQAASIGLLGLGFPEEYGGVAGTDVFHRMIASIELAQCGSGGVLASLMSHTISMPPVAALASVDLRARVLPGVLSGERIAALAVTEPGAAPTSRRLHARGARR